MLNHPIISSKLKEYKEKDNQRIMNKAFKKWEEELKIKEQELETLRL